MDERNPEDLQALLEQFQVNYQKAKEAFETDRNDDLRATMFRCKGDIRRCQERIDAEIKQPKL